MSHRPVMRWQTRRRVSCSTTAWSPITIARSSITSWTVNPGEHWQIVGPTGAGKSTLLSLVTGDHPQGYSNDLIALPPRGSGETIWDIKKHIGYVSSSLHLDYRVSTNVRKTSSCRAILTDRILSGGLRQAA